MWLRARVTDRSVEAAINARRSERLVNAFQTFAISGQC
jgi:hypothetical protein